MLLICWFVPKWDVCVFFHMLCLLDFPFENNIHLKNRIIYMSRILLSKKVYVFFTYTKACCSIGDELLLLQNVPRPWYFTTFIAHAKFSFYYKCLQEMLIDSNMIILFCSVMSDMDDYKYQEKEIKSQGFVFMNIYENKSNYI